MDQAVIVREHVSEIIAKCKSIGEVRKTFRKAGYSGKELTRAVDAHKSAFHQRVAMAVSGLQAKGFTFTSARETKSGDYNIKLSRPKEQQATKAQLIRQIEELQAKLTVQQVVANKKLSELQAQLTAQSATVPSVQ